MKSPDESVQSRVGAIVTGLVEGRSVGSLEVGEKLGINVVNGTVGFLEGLNEVFELVGSMVGLKVGTTVGSRNGAVFTLTVGLTVSLILGLDDVTLLGVKVIMGATTSSNSVRAMALLSSLCNVCLFPLDAVTTTPNRTDNTSIIENATIA
jgi:hypothetical protein